MEIYNMNEYFTDIILQRGLNYYKKGKIISATKINQNTYVFDVEGTVNYNVKIKIHHNEYEMSCNCPYEDNCKHMAACLYYLKFTDGKDIKINKNKKTKTILTPFDKFKLEVNQMVKKCYGRDGYIDYYNGADFVEGIENLTDKIKATLEKDTIENILNKIFYLYNTIETVNMDGSNGEHAIAESYVSEVLGQIFFMYPQKTTDSLLKYFINEKNIIELSSVISNFKDLIHSQQDAKEYLKLIELVLNNDKYSHYYLDYLYIKVYYDYLDENEAIKTGEKQLKKQYNNYIARFLTEKYTYLKKYNKAIELIENNYGKNYDDDEKLLGLYIKTKNKDKYEKLLLKIFDKTSSYNNYHNIKKHFNKEKFAKINKKLLDKMKKSDYHFEDYIKICNENNDIDNLFIICKEKGLVYLSKYLNTIVKKYRVEAINIYKSEVKKLCDVARNQARYDKIIMYLIRLLDIPKTKKDVLEIINYVRENYQTRTLFIKELENLKNKI